MHDNVDELHAGDHELDLELFVVFEVSHQGPETPLFKHGFLEVVEGVEDDFVAAFHQADCGQKLENQGFCTKLFMNLQ